MLRHPAGWPHPGIQADSGFLKALGGSGDGDVEDWSWSWILVDLERLGWQSRFRRGDCNADGTVDVTDPIANLGFQFLGNFEPPCRDACDFDDSGSLEITDAVASTLPTPSSASRCSAI